MKKLSLVAVLFLLIGSAAPGHAFFDYLFGGSSTRDAIDNSAVGDLRTWWSGNPVYQFNPYYSGSSDPVSGQNTQGSGQQYGTGVSNLGSQYGAQQAGSPMQQPSVSYYPPAQGQQQQYGYGQVQPQTQQMYGGGAQGAPQPQAQPVMRYEQAPQQYQQAPQYQTAPQQYQQAPAQYQQAAPQGYAPQGYAPPQQAAPQGYAPQQGAQYYQGAPQQYQ